MFKILFNFFEAISRIWFYICVFFKIATIFAFIPENEFGIKLKASKKLNECSS